MKTTAITPTFCAKKPILNTNKKNRPMINFSRWNRFFEAKKVDISSEMDSIVFTRLNGMKKELEEYAKAKAIKISFFSNSPIKSNFGYDSLAIEIKRSEVQNSIIGFLRAYPNKAKGQPSFEEDVYAVLNQTCERL